MKFGIFYELQLPRPWTDNAEHELFTNALDQIELADRLGYDYAWEVEHHFLEEYSHSSAPEVFLATEVMPEFHEREPQHQAWKQAVLAGEIELEDIDTAPYHVYSLQTPTNRQQMEAALDKLNA